METKKYIKMPDGRTIHAWKTEMDILRSENDRAKEVLQEIGKLKQVLGLIWESYTDNVTLDWVFRIKATEAVSASDLKYNLAKYLKND